MPTFKCQAQNVATCKYHGTLTYHKQQYAEASNSYTKELQSYLESKNPNKADLEEKRNKFLQTQAAYDAHEPNYKKLTEVLEQLKAATTPALEYSDHNQWVSNNVIIKESEERVLLADIYRDKREKPETKDEIDAGWVNDYVARIPAGSKVASGETILDVRRRIGLPSNKREVILQNNKGEKRAAIWGSHTRVTFFPPEPVKPSNGEDPWAPKD